MSMLDSFKQRLSSGEAHDRELMELDGAIDSAFHIGRELVALGELSVPAPSVVDINDLVAQLEGVLANVLGRNIQTTLQLEAVDSLVEAEAVQLEWVFLNLAANSREAMPNGGRFTVQTTSIDRQVGTSPRLRRFVHLTVTDTGHGLFGDARIRAFDPFFSTERRRRRLWPDQRRHDRSQLSGMAPHRKQRTWHQHSHSSASTDAHCPLTGRHRIHPLRKST